MNCSSSSGIWCSRETERGDSEWIDEADAFAEEEARGTYSSRNRADVGGEEEEEGRNWQWYGIFSAGIVFC